MQFYSKSESIPCLEITTQGGKMVVCDIQSIEVASTRKRKWVTVQDDELSKEVITGSASELIETPSQKASDKVNKSFEEFISPPQPKPQPVVKPCSLKGSKRKKSMSNSKVPFIFQDTLYQYYFDWSIVRNAQAFKISEGVDHQEKRFRYQYGWSFS